MKFSTCSAIRSGSQWKEVDLWKVIGMNCEFLDLCTEVKILYSPVEVYRRFGGTSVDLCQTTWSRVPDWKRKSSVIILTMPAVCYGVNVFQAAFFLTCTNKQL
jgi:hypothetical protein